MKEEQHGQKVSGDEKESLPLEGIVEELALPEEQKKTLEKHLSTQSEQIQTLTSQVEKLLLEVEKNKQSGQEKSSKKENSSDDKKIEILRHMYSGEERPFESLEVEPTHLERLKKWGSEQRKRQPTLIWLDKQVEKQRKSLEERPFLTKKSFWVHMAVTLVFCLVLFVGLQNLFLRVEGQPQLVNQLNRSKEMIREQPNEPAHYVDMGHAYYLLGQNRKAIQAYEQAIALDENYFPAYLNLAILYHERGDHKMAIAQAEIAVSLAPQDYKGHFLIGKAYRQLRNYDLALEALQKARDLTPVDGDVLYELGRAVEGKGELEGAKLIYQEVLQYNPRHAAAIAALQSLEKSVTKETEND